MGKHKISQLNGKTSVSIIVLIILGFEVPELYQVKILTTLMSLLNLVIMCLTVFESWIIVHASVSGKNPIKLKVFWLKFYKSLYSHVGTIKVGQP